MYLCSCIVVYMYVYIYIGQEIFCSDKLWIDEVVSSQRSIVDLASS